MNQTIQTDFLVPTSGLLSGFGSVLDISGSFHEYNRSATPTEADAKAIGADWAMVGKDMAEAVKKGEAVER